MDGWAVNGIVVALLRLICKKTGLSPDTFRHLLELIQSYLDGASMPG